MMFFLILIIVIIIIIAFVHYNKHENDAPENEYTPTNKYVSVNKTIPAANVKRKSAAPFDGYMLSVALDSRTCLVCGLKDGRVFKTNTGALRHKCLNDYCRCVSVPVYKGMDFDDDDERAAMGGPVPANWTYEIWFNNQKNITKREILGSKYYNLFTTNNMTLSEITELVKNDIEFKESKAWINDINDGELSFSNLSLNDVLLNKINSDYEIKDCFYYYPTHSTGRHLRKIIRSREASNKPIEELYEILYVAGVISSLALPESQNIGTGCILEIIPGGSLFKLSIPYKEIGYEKIDFFTKGDWKVFNKLWGKPERHITLHEYYPEIYEFYENKFINEFMK